MNTLHATILTGLITLCSCAGSGTSAPAATLDLQGAAVTSTIATSAGTTPTVASAPVDTPAVGSSEPATPRNETPLAAGTYRTDKVVGPIVPVTFDLPVDGLYTLAEEGFLGVHADAAGTEPLFSVIEVDNTLAFTVPTISFELLADQSYMESVTEPAPVDLLAWLATRPGITAGPIVESTVAGQPARSMTYSAGPFDGAQPCVPDEPRACAATIFAPITGLAQFYFVGDSGTISELRMGGHRLAVDVLDRPRAAEIASSLELTVVPPPGVPGNAEPVPFVGPHTEGALYYSERSSGGVYLFDGVEGLSTASSFLRTSQLFLEATDGSTFSEVFGAKCLAITDVSVSTWRGSLAEGSPPLVSPPMPDDLIAAIAGLDLLTVVTPPFQIDLAGISPTAIDVTAVGGEVAVLDRSLGVVRGQTTRFVTVPRSDGQGIDLVSVVIGSPCEPVLAGIRTVPVGR